MTFTSIVFPRNDDRRGLDIMVHGKDTGPRPLGEAVKPLTCVSNFVTGPAKPTIVCFVGHSPKCNWQSLCVCRLGTAFSRVFTRRKTGTKGKTAADGTSV